MKSKLKSKELWLNKKNLKQAIDKRLTFIFEIKPQKEHFLVKYHRFFSYWSLYFSTLLRWENTYVCQQLRTEKQEIINKEIIKQESGIELTFTLEINIQKKHFSEKDQQFFSWWNAHFQPLLG